MGENSCFWEWDGFEWQPHHLIPHFCPAEEHCIVPPQRGMNVGDETETYCAA